MDKAEAYKIHHQWIEECEKVESLLSEWELQFVKSVKDQLEKKGSLSARQIEVLERIYADKTS